MIQLKSRWAKDVNEEHVLPEYPRPTLVREQFQNLNGLWDYTISKEEVPACYEGKILVPFSPETYLSGVERIVKPEEYLHYRRTFEAPENFANERVLLHFGAVDQECRVWVNGQYVGEHAGGYLAFSFDITDTLHAGENELRVCVKDQTEKSPHARGKQRLKRTGPMSSLFYTPQSGIWKTVWMEKVPKEYVENVKITPLYDEGAIELLVKANDAGSSEVTVFSEGDEVAKQTVVVNETCKIVLDNVVPWTAEQPHLYDVKITYKEDVVTSYFGMRKFSIEKDEKGILRFFMNDKPIFFNGVLDQGYWPESLLTAPTEEALKYDILKLKSLGFNTIRKHIKIEPERFYYLCDKLGMFVWQDMPNGGGEYNMYFVTYLPNVLECAARGIKDNKYKWFKRDDVQGREQYRKDLREMVEQLYAHPSIAVWVPFNEGWGQFDANQATALIRSIDQTRFVNEACGWFDQQGGDMFSIHNYLRKLKVKPKKDRVVALTEYGGYAFPIPGHMYSEKEFGYKHYRTREELTESYRKLWEEQIYPNVEKGMSSAIYTQTSDIEEEINGLMTYDREVDKFESETIRELNQKLYEVYEKSCKG